MIKERERERERERQYCHSEFIRERSVKIYVGAEIDRDSGTVNWTKETDGIRYISNVIKKKGSVLRYVRGKEFFLLQIYSQKNKK